MVGKFGKFAHVAAGKLRLFHIPDLGEQIHHRLGKIAEGVGKNGLREVVGVGVVLDARLDVLLAVVFADVALVLVQKGDAFDEAEEAVVVAAAAQPALRKFQQIHVGDDDFERAQKPLGVVVEGADFFLQPFHFPAVEGAGLALGGKDGAGLRVAFIEVDFKTAVLVLGVDLVAGGGFHVGDGAEDFEGFGFDASAVRVFDGDGELEDFAGLQGSYRVFAFFAAVAFVNDEKFVLEGVALEVVEGLGSQTAEEMNVLGRHEFGDAFHEVALPRSALAADDS